MLKSTTRSGSDGVPPAVAWRRLLRWQLRHRLTALGWPGIIAIILLAAAPLCYFSAIRPLQARLDTVQSNAVSAQEQALIVGKAAHDVPSSPREQLAEFYKFFPSEKDAPQGLEKLVALAEQNDLGVNDGEYGVTKDRVGQLLRLRIAFPVQGKYPRIREFLASLPREIPSMSMEKVQFERNNNIDSSVQAKITLVLYLVQKS